jgi:hypothetical protein
VVSRNPQGKELGRGLKIEAGEAAGCGLGLDRNPEYKPPFKNGNSGCTSGVVAAADAQKSSTNLVERPGRIVDKRREARPPKVLFALPLFALCLILRQRQSLNVESN